ncbi:SDR family NAD(P)-dependent oxidoreductase [Clostridium sardiniense]|uniref:SDR family NAD(P)-dependent oxidoreductase n=1 Tax=Clostridium sardiniense TaxID=29369 RepID=UPI003D3424E3
MNKRILVTGAGTGLGKEASIELAKRGHFVLATTHYEDEAKCINKYAIENGLDVNLKSFKLDILLDEDRKMILEYDLDILINNAAIGDSGSVCEIDVDRYRKTFETNVFSAIELTQLFLCKVIPKGEGRVIFVSSLFGRESFPFLSPYTATKFALEGIAESFREEMKVLKDCTIDIVLIEPGAYATGFNQKNIEKKYNWMREDSYFKEQVEEIKSSEEKAFNLMEASRYDSIIEKYIKAVEEVKPKDRYVAPKYQGALIQSMRIFGK